MVLVDNVSERLCWQRPSVHAGYNLKGASPCSRSGQPTRCDSCPSAVLRQLRAEPGIKNGLGHEDCIQKRNRYRQSSCLSAPGLRVFRKEEAPCPRKFVPNFQSSEPRHRVPQLNEISHPRPPIQAPAERCHVFERTRPKLRRESGSLRDRARLRRGASYTPVARDVHFDGAPVP